MVRATCSCLKFKQQEPMGGYVVDFVCHEARLIVEADGRQHVDNPDDPERTAWLEQRGYRVLRFWNNEILQNKENVLETILQAVKETSRFGFRTPLPHPLPQGERETLT